MLLRLPRDYSSAPVPDTGAPPLTASTTDATRSAVSGVLAAAESGGLISEVVFQAPEGVISHLEDRAKHYLSDDAHSTLDPGRSLERHPRGDWVDDREPTLSTTLLFVALFTFTFPSAVAAANHGWWYFAATAVVWAAATTSYIWWRLLDPLRLTRGQRRLLTTPVAYGGWLSDTTTDTTTLAPGSYPAATLAMVARSTVADIRTCPAWGDQHLDTHHVRVDLDGELADFMTTARALDLLQQGPSTPVVDSTNTASDHVEQAASVHESLMDRLVALFRYRDGLTPLESLLYDRTTFQLRSELDARHDPVLSHAGVTTGAAELADAEVRLTLQTDILKGHVTAQRQ